MMLEHTEKFNKQGCVFVENFIDAPTVKIISRYMENALNQSHFSDRELFQDDDENKDPSSKYSKYGDPLIESILVERKTDIQKIVGYELYPTYSYLRLYMENDELRPHRDRPSCEFSVTINVAALGNMWPIYMKTREKTEAKFLLNPGDAVVYRGCDLLHWRKPINECGAEMSAQFMLHYVDQNGRFKDYKWDKRPRLGTPCSQRGKQVTEENNHAYRNI